MLKLSIAALLAGLGLLVWLVASRLSSDAIGLALGVIFGVLAILPAVMVTAVGRRREPEVGRRREPEVVYRDRVVYRIAEPIENEPELPKRPTARLADDWLVDCLDSQAQVQLGVTRRQLPERRKVTP